MKPRYSIGQEVRTLTGRQNIQRDAIGIVQSHSAQPLLCRVVSDLPIEAIECYTYDVKCGTYTHNYPEYDLEAANEEV